MPFWYNAAKDGEKYASLACSDWGQANSKFEFDELTAVADDDFWYVFAHVSKITDVINTKDRGWKFDPQLLSFKVAKKDYQKEDYKTKAKTDVKQSLLEQWMCKLFSELPEGKVFKGFIDLQENKFLQTFLTGVDFGGKPIPPEVNKMMESQSAFFEEVGEPSKIKPDEIKVPVKRAGGYSSAKAQTELEKLNDRITFIRQHLAVVVPDYEWRDVSSLHAYGGHPDAETIALTISTLMEIMKG